MAGNPFLLMELLRRLTRMDDDPITLPKQENVFETVRYVPPSRRHEITWLVLLSIVAVTGVAALILGWWLAGGIVAIGGALPAGAILRHIIAERRMIRRMRGRSAQDMSTQWVNHTTAPHRKKKTDGPPGIRPAVWLFVFGLALVCMLLISRHHIEQPTREMVVEEVPEQNTSPHSGPKIRRIAQTEVKLEAYEDQVGYRNGEIDLSMVEQMVQDRRTWMDDPGF